MSAAGQNLLAGQWVVGEGAAFRAADPVTGETFGPEFHEASEAQAAAAVRAAAEAFAAYRATLPAARAAFLERIAGEIEALGDPLLQTCHRETGLPLARLTGERGRTCGQLRLFAGLVREGSWVDARIDLALPERQPLPRPDLRRMLQALGPVAVFGASNFPLAFSVAGGDTAAALAAGCPVVFKAHPAHPGTCELVAGAIARAVAAEGLPPATFSLVHGGPPVGLALVRHPALTAAAFTGSHTAGRALFDAAVARAQPIPVFAEMSSVNPVILLPEAVRTKAAAIAQGLAASVTLGSGQFCTKPGLVFLQAGTEADQFLEHLAGVLGAAPSGTLLTAGIERAYAAGRRQIAAAPGVTECAFSAASAPTAKTAARPGLAVTTGAQLLQTPGLAHEVFGPFCLAVLVASAAELTACLGQLEGQLTATVHGTADDLAGTSPLMALLAQKAGRIVVNGFPTGVEVSPAMNHGGPYPATTDARYTSVGTAGILRFVRPVCYQSFPGELLPAELRDGNPRGILRLVNGEPTRA